MNYYERLDLVDHLTPTDENCALDWFQKMDSILKAQNISNDDTFNLAVIVHPGLNEMITFAIDEREKHPLKHAVMNAIDQVAIQETTKRDNSTIPLKKRAKIDPHERNYGYLCTGLDVYLLKEPCVMYIISN